MTHVSASPASCSVSQARHWAHRDPGTGVPRLRGVGAAARWTGRWRLDGAAGMASGLGVGGVLTYRGGAMRREGAGGR